MKLPEWLKELPKGAQVIGQNVYAAAMSADKDEDAARRAAMAAIEAKFIQGPDGTWQVRAGVAGAERTQALRFRASQAVDDTGLVWEAVLIAPGLSLGYPKFYWSEDLLAASVDLFNGVSVNAYEVTADFFSHLPIPNMDALEDVKRYLTAKKVGWIDEAAYVPGEGIRAKIHFLAEHRWLPDMIAQGIAAGNPDVMGLSIDSRVQAVEVIMDDWAVLWPTDITGCSSVDVVTRPAAGGKFIRAVAGLGRQLDNQEDVMNREKIIAMIQKARPDLLAGKDVATIGDAEVMTLAQMAMASAADGEKAPAAGLSAADVKALINTAVSSQTEQIEKRAACGRMLDAALIEAALPAPTAARIRTRFDGQVFEKPALDAEVKAEKDYLAQMGQGAAPDVGDQTRFNVGIGTIEKAQLAVDRTFGLKKDDMEKMARMCRLDNRPFFSDIRAAQDLGDYDKIPAFSGLREMYEFFTGDSEVTGRFNRKALPPELRAAQDITSATFSYVLGNTMGRRLVADYQEADFGEDLLISNRKPVKDFRQQEAVNVGYFGDLADVDPESGEYQEIAGTTDEESTYAIGQKGNLLTFHRKVVINDDLGLVQRKLGRLGRAARRTHAKYVWNFFIDNATCSDGTSWFTEGHSNLSTSALAIATALAAYQFLATTTEKDSDERIGLLGGPGVKPILLYPVDLMATAESIVEDEFYYTTNDLTTKTRNPLRGKITGRMVPLFTDANDWGMVMPAAVMDVVEMGYLNGRQEPELFVADSPQSEQVFVADKIRHKIRHEYAGALVDCNSGYKGVVA